MWSLKIVYSKSTYIIVMASVNYQIDTTYIILARES